MKSVHDCNFPFKGTITSVIACYRQHDMVKVADLDCDASKKPSAGQPESCKMHDCSQKYSWNVVYSTCSVTCGKGLFNVFILV